ncbi:MAG: CCA tRNA nucleotidyltransferase [Pirellulales bacterium]|nr:CCA tRNA nucleotidyltransferase [Pirellulales bacterium]
MSSPRQFALDVVTALRGEGFEAFWAGGCVRDQLLGREPKDYDVATSARPDIVRALFGKRRTIAIGAAFGVIGVLGPRGSSPLEVATFRTDGVYRDGRHPDSVAFSDAEHDAQRRDFTINGLFYDPVAELVVDYVDGQRDLAAGVVRAIGDPRRRFDEDKLRLLRAVRFATTFDFEIEAATLAAICDMAPQTTIVSAERIGAELRRILANPNRALGMRLLGETNLLEAVAPELAGALAEPTAWEAALGRLENLAVESLPAALALASVDRLSPPAVRELCRTWRLTNKEGRLAEWLVEHLPEMRHAAELPWPRLQRLLIHSGAAELTAAAAAEQGEASPHVRRLRDTLALAPAELDPPPLATGDDLKAAGIKPGKHFAVLLEHLRDEQLLGRLSSREEALVAAAEWLARRRGRPAEG